MPEQHATPWYYEVEKAGDTHVYSVFNDAAYLVCVTYTKTQAEFICRACNSHAFLVDALKAMHDTLVIEITAVKVAESRKRLMTALAQARAALAAAEGK